MKLKLKAPGFFIYFIFLIFSSVIVFTASACCFAGQTVTVATETMPDETTTQNGQAQVDSDPGQTAEEIDVQNDLSDLIVVRSPTPGQAVSSPLTVTGKARGTWYFEADFPVKLLDADGNVLASHYGQAQGEWMTEDFVPFIAEIVFENPATETGTLVLEKDNPSGLKENDAKIEIPVSFKAKSDN